MTTQCHLLWFPIGLQSLGYYVIGSMTQQRIPTWRCYYEASGWQDRFSETPCLSGSFIWCCCHYYGLGLLRPTDSQVNLKWRTPKTCFLLAMAMARRKSYIHALSVAHAHITFGRGDVEGQSTVSLLPESGFMAKNQLRSQVTQWVTVPGIAHLIPHEMERILCPVRQLQLYLHDLFLHRKPHARDIQMDYWGGKDCLPIQWSSYSIYNRNTAWLRDTVRQTSRGKSVAAGWTAPAADFPRDVCLTVSSNHAVFLLSSTNV